MVGGPQAQFGRRGNVLPVSEFELLPLDRPVRSQPIYRLRLGILIGMLLNYVISTSDVILPSENMTALLEGCFIGGPELRWRGQPT
jgi:hypothetical protein